MVSSSRVEMLKRMAHGPSWDQLEPHLDHDDEKKVAPIGFPTADTLEVIPAQPEADETFDSVSEKSEKTATGNFMEWLGRFFGKSPKQEASAEAVTSVANSKPLPPRPELPAPTDVVGTNTLEQYIKAAKAANTSAEALEEENEKNQSRWGKVDAALLKMLVDRFKDMERLRLLGLEAATDHLNGIRPELKKVHEEWEANHRKLEKVEKRRKALGVFGNIVGAVNVVLAIGMGAAMFFTGGATLPAAYQFAMGAGAALGGTNSVLKGVTDKESGDIRGDFELLTHHREVAKEKQSQATGAVKRESESLSQLHSHMARVIKALLRDRIV